MKRCKSFFHIPYSIALATVGLLESMMTATIVDDLTDTTSDKNRECKGQGVANIATGLIGGMVGCGMISPSIINVNPVVVPACRHSQPVCSY